MAIAPVDPRTAPSNRSTLTPHVETYPADQVFCRKRETNRKLRRQPWYRMRRGPGSPTGRLAVRRQQIIGWLVSARSPAR